MRKIKVKTLYLIAIVVGGLIGLATKSTYALFTSSTGIDNPICMSTNLTSEEEVVDTMDVIVTSGEAIEVPITINNTSDSSLNYMVFYNPTSSDIEIGVNMENSDSSNSFGTINKNETKKVYVQIKNNSTSSITLKIGVVSNNISSDMSPIPIGKEGESTITIGKSLAEYITNLYTNATKTTVTNNSVIYNYATSVNLMNDRLGSMSTGIDNGNIRYYGLTPNNYIYFNCSDYNNQSSDTCELWRIIGVFDGKVKIIRNESIGTYSWDNSSTTSNYGSNNWATARLMRLLNPGYTGISGSLYWSAGSGTCYTEGTKDATKVCDFTSIGLKNEETRGLISASLWYLRGWNTAEVYTNQMYEYEKTTGSVYNTSNPTIWKGSVALLYPSDYGYATDLGLCTKQLSGYSDSLCTSDNWMKPINTITNGSSSISWLLTPNPKKSDTVCYISSDGSINCGQTNSMLSSAYIWNHVLPTLYLNSESMLNGVGDGTSDNPYQIKVN